MKKIFSLVIAFAIILIFAADVFAQNPVHSARIPVTNEKAQGFFVGGKIYTGWAGDIVNEDFPNQFFLNRVYLTFTGLLNEDVSFRLRLEGLGDKGAGGMAIKHAYVRFGNLNFLNMASKLEIGVVGALWESFETQIWRYRVLRQVTSGIFGYASSTDVGVNYSMNFNDNQVSLQLGIWNGAFKKYTVWGLGSKVTDNLTNENLSAGAFLIFNQEGGSSKKAKYGGFVASVGMMLNNKPDVSAIDETNTGYRILGGLYYISRDSKIGHQFTIGLSGGYIIDFEKKDGGSPALDMTEDAYFASFFMLINLSILGGENTKEWEIILKVDYNNRGPRGAGPAPMYNDETKDDVQLGATFAISFHPYSWLWIIPAYRADFLDIGTDNNLVGIWIELRY